MKIALIGTTTETILGFRTHLIRALVDMGAEVYVLSMDYSRDSKNRVADLGATPIDYRFSRGGLSPAVDLMNTIRLARILKRLSPDLVFSYFVKPVIFGTLAAWLAGVRRRIGMLEGLGFVFTDQPGGISARTRLLRAVQVSLYRIALPKLERLILLNPDDKKDLVDHYRVPVRNVTVLGGIGVDLDEFPYSEPPRDPMTFIFVGRLLAEKGINEYLDAAQLVKGHYPEARFIVIGGPDHANPGAVSERRVLELSKVGIIEYPGAVDNVSHWIADSSVFILPSYREGVPRSTQEAMAIGRPVITTDMPGCRETVIDGVNGFLIPPWDPDDLARRMIYFIENPEAVLTMGQRSHQIALEHFDVHKVNERLLRMLDLCGTFEIMPSPHTEGRPNRWGTRNAKRPARRPCQ